MSSLLAMLPPLLPLILIAVVFIFVSRFLERPKCPECGARMKMSSRTVEDRYSTLKKDEHRYSCPGCGHWYAEQYSATAKTPNTRLSKRDRDRLPWRRE